MSYSSSSSTPRRSSQQQRGTRRPAFSQKLNLDMGNIVFLQAVNSMNDYDRSTLIDSGYLPPRAAGHPVIILEHQIGSTHALVTTVSAYSSGPNNNSLAPWKQCVHRQKRSVDFRAFEGSELSDQRCPALQLMPGQSMPKPETSWVYTKSAFTVPVTALQHFNKTRGVQLAMTKQSLEDLCKHIKQSPRMRAMFHNPRISNAVIPQPPQISTIVPPTSIHNTKTRPAMPPTRPGVQPVATNKLVTPSRTTCSGNGRQSWAGVAASGMPCRAAQVPVECR